MGNEPFKGWHYTELSERWGLAHGDGDDLEVLREHITKSLWGIHTGSDGIERASKVVEDFREFLVSLSIAEEKTVGPMQAKLWKFLAEWGKGEEDQLYVIHTFLSHCMSLIDRMWS